MAKMRYQRPGAKKRTIKLMTERKTGDGAQIFSIAEVQEGDIADLSGDELRFAKLARCQDGSPAWVEAESDAEVTVQFQPVLPKPPSRRTAWKGRKQHVDAAKKKKQ
jgi:hypothetical protein